MKSERDEKIWIQGYNRALRSVLGFLLHDLPDRDMKRYAWIKERMDAISMLRQICDQYGDNDWEDDLYLADIIEKHLWRHLGQ